MSRHLHLHVLPDNTHRVLRRRGGKLFIKCRICVAKAYLVTRDWAKPAIALQGEVKFDSMTGPPPVPTPSSSSGLPPLSLVLFLLSTSPPFHRVCRVGIIYLFQQGPISRARFASRYSSSLHIAYTDETEISIDWSINILVLQESMPELANKHFVNPTLYNAASSMRQNIPLLHPLTSNSSTDLS